MREAECNVPQRGYLHLGAWLEKECQHWRLNILKQQASKETELSLCLFISFHGLVLVT